MRAATSNKLGLLVVLLILCAASNWANTEEKSEPIVDEEWRSLVFTPFTADRGFTFHRPTFILPYTASDEYSGEQTEIVGQLSFKIQILDTRFYGGYTMISFWQAYDTGNSSPFRETNYNPELFYRMTPSNSNLRKWGFDIGGEHNSNGQTIERSRSWNRVYFAPHYRFGKSVVAGKVWYRIPEDDCIPGVQEIECDNNPDINEFYGYSEFTYDVELGDRPKPRLLHVMVGGNISTGKGRISASFSYPALSKDVYWHLWAFHGYGESLIDYDQSRSRIGVGFRFLR